MRRRGLTTLELLVALGVTTITGMGVAMVITSVSRGVATMNATRGAMQRASTSHVRLRSYTDTALCLLAHDARGLALWAHDERANGLINVSELRIFWYDDDEGELSVEFIDFPESMDDAAREIADFTITPAEDPFAIMLAQRALGFTDDAVLADGIGRVTVSHASADPIDNERFRVLLGYTSLGQNEELLMAVGLPRYRRPE